MNTAPIQSQADPRQLAVLWADHSWPVTVRKSAKCEVMGAECESSDWTMARFYGGGARTSACSLPNLGLTRETSPSGLTLDAPRSTLHAPRRAFTILEMLIVVAIIGFLAAVALPHLGGMTRANSMTTAIQQLLGDCSLARQLAMTRRSTVYMVFVPPYMTNNGAPANEQSSYNNLLAHQYGAYALVSLRTVGDQPGQAHPQYLTEWKPLPDGVFVAPFKFNLNSLVPVTAYSTNTLTGTRNVLPIAPFPYQYFPFPAADALVEPGHTAIFAMPLPYIGFTPLGQLVPRNGENPPLDEYIPLSRGHVQYVAGTQTAGFAMEAPAGNSTNNPNVIHIDGLTARAKIERNQLR